MSQLIVAPEMMTSAASDLATIGSNVNAAHMVAAAPTTAILPAAADDVSASIAHLFSQHAASYQAQAAQAVAFNDQFVQHLTAGADSYAHAEAANIALLRPLTASAGAMGNAISGQVVTLDPVAFFGILIFLPFVVGVIGAALIIALLGPLIP
jgi:hypothetical protein